MIGQLRAGRGPACLSSCVRLIVKILLRPLPAHRAAMDYTLAGV
jgi:hypothetical protein